MYHNLNHPEFHRSFLHFIQETGKHLCDLQNEQVEVSYKKDSSPVSSADLFSHSAIVEFLHKFFPQTPIISEESGNIPSNLPENYFLIDPLDGTKAFLRGKKSFSINIALIENSRIVAGCIYIPRFDILYYGDEDIGCWRYHFLTEETLSLESSPSMAKPLILTSYDFPALTKNKILQESPHFSFESIGGAYKGGLVAEGYAQMAILHHPTCAWDIAPAILLLHLLEGKVYQWDHTPIDVRLTKLYFPTPVYFLHSSLEKIGFRPNLS